MPGKGRKGREAERGRFVYPEVCGLAHGLLASGSGPQRLEQVASGLEAQHVVVALVRGLRRLELLREVEFETIRDNSRQFETIRDNSRRTCGA